VPYVATDDCTRTADLGGLRLKPGKTSCKLLEEFGLLWKRGAGEETRTPDPIITNDVLYQLSYTGTLPCLGPTMALLDLQLPI
jgi:hypothetical protein